MQFSDEMASRLKEAGHFLRSISSCPGGSSGRGCIIAGGGRYAVSAFVTASELRRLGWTEAVEVWYLGASEMDAGLRAAFAGLDVRCVDARGYLPLSPMKSFGGWESKVFSVLHSRFEEVLFLDADCVPAVNPQALFAFPGYLETGAIFWPDLERARHDAGQPRWEVFGVPYRNVPEWETGQFLVNKSRCWESLLLAHYYNANSGYYYRFVHGDKDCCHMAWLKTGQPFCLMPETEPRPWGLRQFDPEGSLLFQHRTLAKFRFGEPAGYPDFVHGEICQGHVAELEKLWPGFDPVWAPRGEQERHQVQELSGEYLYAPAGAAPGRLRLLPNGVVSDREGVPWTAWRPGTDGSTDLILSTADGWNCTAYTNGPYHTGRWPMHWDAPFLLLRPPSGN